MNGEYSYRYGVAQLLGLPRFTKNLLAITVDLALCVITTWLALCLRLEGLVVFEPAHWWAVWGAALLALPLFVRFGLYRAIFRFSGGNALLSLMRAMGLYSLLYATVFTAVGVPGVPRTVGILQPILLFGGVGLVRAMARYWLSGSYQSALLLQSMPGVLIYGAGSAGRQLASALARSREYRLLGFLDDDDRFWGKTVDARPVYNPADLGELIPELEVTDVLLAVPSASRQNRMQILNTMRHLAVHVRTLPGMADLASGRVKLSDVQEIEIEDLLGRETIPPNRLLLNLSTHGKVVLVTGAGGSIGSELCRQIIKCQPSVLLLVEMNEFALYQIHQELLKGGDGSALEIVPLLASVRNEELMQKIMSTWRPHTVYHAAAYKHVPLVEHNAAEGVRNNVWGTWICAQVAARNGVQSFILISTDKAVRPTNIMGASKRLAEMVLQGLHTQTSAAHTTCFSMVRFGNVLGSSGSVVPLFRDQIKNGGPITLTHADITRYFMTIPEAAQLVIQAGAMATGGDVFVLDMGEPVRIYDLAQQMVELAGLTLRDIDNPNGDIEIEITGLRPGEKLYEELLIGDNPQPTQHDRIMKAHEDCLPWDQLQDQLKAMQLAISGSDVPALKAMLQHLVAGYQPANVVVDFLHVAQESNTSGPLNIQEGLSV